MFTVLQTDSYFTLPFQIRETHVHLTVHTDWTQTSMEKEGAEGRKEEAPTTPIPRGVGERGSLPEHMSKPLKKKQSFPKGVTL